MRVACAATAAELKGQTPDILLLPEGVPQSEFQCAIEALPSTLIIGAIDDGHSVSAYAFHEGVERCRYVKVRPEKPGYVSGETTQRPVFHFGPVCIGVLICRDIDYGDFRASVIDAVKSSDATTRLICIPADMAAHWFPQANIGPDFRGVHVLLSNLSRWDGQNRCQSFFAGPDGLRLNAVAAGQPLIADL